MYIFLFFCFNFFFDKPFEAANFSIYKKNEIKTQKGICGTVCLVSVRNNLITMIPLAKGYQKLLKGFISFQKLSLTTSNSAKSKSKITKNVNSSGIN